MIDSLTEMSGRLSGLLWNSPFTLLTLIGIGLYLTIRLRFIQIFGVKHAIKLVSGKYTKTETSSAGEVTHFQALSTALSGTIGTGNIAGVATAISLGGPGALFWMWITAVLGMATKFAESTLAIHYRQVHQNGETAGGPMYTLLNGLNMRRTALLFAGFALLASLGIGNVVQANSIIDGLSFIWPNLIDNPKLSGIIGSALALCVGLVIIGGVKRIAKVASTIVPVMALFYIMTALLVLFTHISQIPAALSTIFTMALNPWAVGAGAVGEAIRWGVARGLFSNEAGLGSSAMAHAAAKTNQPIREGLVAMLEPLIDTLIICSMTGLVIVITGAYTSAEGVQGASLTAQAFNMGINGGGWVVGIGLTLFAFSTMLSWSYYGDRSAQFLFGHKAVLPYRIAFTILIAIGAAVPLKLVWNFADIANLLMVIPNLLALILLTPVVIKLKQDYWQNNKQ